MHRHARILMFSLVLLFGLSFALTSIASCRSFDINDSNEEYIVTVATLNSAGTCFYMDGLENATIDCQGALINYTGGAINWRYGIDADDLYNVTIRNCRVEGWQYDLQWGIYVGHSSNTTLRNCTLDNNWYGINVAYGNMSIHDCKINDSDITAIDADNMYDVLVDGCTATNGNSGISADNTDRVVFRNNLVQDNLYGMRASGTAYVYNNTIINASSGDCFELRNGHLSMVYNNTINGCRKGAGFTDTFGLDTDNTFHSNRVYNAATGLLCSNSPGFTAYNNTLNLTSTGIQVSECHNFSIYDNTITDTSSYGIFVEDASDGQAYGNTLWGAGRRGILLETAHNVLISRNIVSHAQIGYQDQVSRRSLNTFDSNTAHSVRIGFNFTRTNNLTATNNLAYNCSYVGFLFVLCPNATIGGNTARNNSAGMGLAIPGGDRGTTLYNNIFYNNLVADLYVTGAGGVYTPALLNMQDSVFRNPAGSTTMGYTTLSILDELEWYAFNGAGWETYAINWTAQPAPPPNAFLTSFNGKFLELTGLYYPNITYIEWSWEDGEASDYDEPSFQLWEYDGRSWNLINNTPDTGANTLAAHNLVFRSTYGIFGVREDGGDGEPECTWDEDCQYCEYCSAGNCVYDPACVPPECETDDDCPSDEECVEEECITVDCDCGEVVNHECHEYECCDDDDCPDGYECTAHECEEEEPECDEDGDCSGSQYCSDGDCLEVDCECGTIIEHKCIKYECCTDADCESGFACNGATHVCEEIVEEEPPLPEPTEIAKDVVPLVEGEPEEPQEDLVDTILRGVWIAIPLLILIGIIFTLLRKKKGRPKE